MSIRQRFANAVGSTVSKFSSQATRILNISKYITGFGEEEAEELSATLLTFTQDAEMLSGKFKLTEQQAAFAAISAQLRLMSHGQWHLVTGPRQEPTPIEVKARVVDPPTA